MKNLEKFQLTNEEISKISGGTSNPLITPIVFPEELLNYYGTVIDNAQEAAESLWEGIESLFE
ncbi:MAG: hypothetical protein AAFQ94_13585 [Bacteroidota bacterium]